MQITLGPVYDVGEKPIVILCLRCIERYCMTPRQRDDDNNLSVGNRNHLKLGIEPESWLQSHELGF